MSHRAAPMILGLVAVLVVAAVVVGIAYFLIYEPVISLF